MTFTTTTVGDTVTCLACGARIGNNAADKVEHLTTPSRAKAVKKRRSSKPATTQGDTP